MRRNDRPVLIGTAAALFAAAVAAAFGLRGAAPEAEIRFRIPLSLTAEPYNAVIQSLNLAGSNFAVSPDGRAMVFVGKSNLGNDPSALYYRPTASVTPRRLAGTENAELPFWSADGRFIGYVASGKLRKVEASGGPPQDVCAAAGFAGGTWNMEGTILFGSATGLMKVSAEGGTPEPVTELESGETGHLWPHFLRDGRSYLRFPIAIATPIPIAIPMVHRSIFGTGFRG